MYFQWCYRKKCVQIGQRPEAINGGWGKWSPFTECSRSCGGGVQISSRDCDNPPPQHRGRYCLGERKKIKICNMDVSFPQQVIIDLDISCKSSRVPPVLRLSGSFSARSTTTSLSGTRCTSGKRSSKKVKQQNCE